MKNLICKFTIDDDYPVPEDSLLCNFDEYGFTFWNSQLQRLPRYMKPIGIDLLMLSLAVYGADRWFLRREAVDAWERDIHIHLPVLELDRMNQEKELIEKMLSFLSGDKWRLSFRQRAVTVKEKMWQDRIENGTNVKIAAKKICMFSGGLDSFIGAIDLLENDRNDTIFVSIYGGGRGVREYQRLLTKAIEIEYKINDDKFFSFYVVPKRGEEGTMRTRSLMFYCHAVALATCFDLDDDIELIVPENGYISLNVPLTYSRLGSSSTRTTHPHYMNLFQQLLQELEIRLNIKNPYQFKTKGEMILECKNQEFLKNNVHSTMSCSHPVVGRMRKESEAQHCGTCLPCVVRRAAIKKAGIIDSTKYYDPKFELGPTARTNLNSYLLGLEHYNEEDAYLTIQMSGSLNNDLERYESIYKRGVAEIRNLLEEYNGIS